MKTDPQKKPTATKVNATSASQPEETARARAAALAGISAPSAGTISKPDWDEFNRELDERENRQSRPAVTPLPSPTITTRKSKT